ncbi:LPO_1073/Vpar_1526 family protein [Paraburkholderia sp. 22098]|uniref:LPO_1073/Vpar_1526 family protein n=1 Tax=Paraburkholderia sp. 22098 TaxID=3453874 RepID=UPI003F857EFC
MLNKEQSQQGGDNAVNAQAGRDVIVQQGITYADARQIALDVYRANALELQGIAQETARTRAEHLVERFLTEMRKAHAEALPPEVANPDFQHSLFEAQKSFARSGDANQEETLVSLLTERAGEPNRSLRQVVLNEAIIVMSRLTAEQLSLLTLIFLLRHCRGQFPHEAALWEYLRHAVLPLAASIPDTQGVYTYLAYTGAVTVELGEFRFSQLLHKVYPTMLARGLDSNHFDALLAREPAAAQFVAPCPADLALKHVTGGDENLLREAANARGLSEQTIVELVGLQSQNLMPEAEIDARVSGMGPNGARLVRLWNSTPMRQVVVTAVGMAVAHANARRLGLVQADLSVWVN